VKQGIGDYRALLAGRHGTGKTILSEKGKREGALSLPVKERVQKEHPRFKRLRGRKGASTPKTNLAGLTEKTVRKDLTSGREGRGKELL